EVQRSRGHDESGDTNLAPANPAPRCSLVRKEGHGRARLAGFVAKIKMVDIRGVEVDGDFDQPQAEDAGVEIDCGLGIAGESRDMVNARRLCRHLRPPPWFPLTMTFVCPLSSPCTPRGGL